MLEFQQHNQYVIFNFDQPIADQFQFFNPEYWQNTGRISGSAKGRGTTYFLATEDLFGVNVALRHYYRGGLWGKINKDSYHFHRLEQTRSFAEFHLLNKLNQAGLAVPKPIGAKVEKTRFGGYRADILTEQIENAQDLTKLLQTQTLPTAIWAQIGGLIRQLHDLQICHTDLNAHNILLQEGTKCWLIDFDKCGEKTGDAWKQENLLRLHRSFQKEISRMQIQFSPENWQDLLAGYYAK